jgi:hypothetical protein
VTFSRLCPPAKVLGSAAAPSPAKNLRREARNEVMSPLVTDFEAKSRRKRTHEIAGLFRWLLARPGVDEVQQTDQGSLPAQRAATAAAKSEQAVNPNRSTI